MSSIQWGVRHCAAFLVGLRAHKPGLIRIFFDHSAPAKTVMEPDPALPPQRIAVDFGVARTLPVLRATGADFLPHDDLGTFARSIFAHTT
jgi:hypothetical protein